VDAIKSKSSTLEPGTLIRKTKTNSTDKSAVKTTEHSIVNNNQTSPDGELFNRKIIKSQSSVPQATIIQKFLIKILIMILIL